MTAVHTNHDAKDANMRTFGNNSQLIIMLSATKTQILAEISRLLCPSLVRVNAQAGCICGYRDTHLMAIFMPCGDAAEWLIFSGMI